MSDPAAPPLAPKPPLARRLRRIASLARDLVFVLADGLVAATVARLPRQPKLDERGRPRLAILVAHGVGDLVLWRAALDRLRERYPPDRFETTIVCAAAALEFATAHIPADHYLPIERQGFRTRLRTRLPLIRRVVARNFSIVIQPTFNRYFLVEDALVRASRAAERIGSTGTSLFLRPCERRISDRWYTRLIPATQAPLHELDRSAEFLRGLGLPVPGLAAPSLPLARLSATPAAPGGHVLIGVSASSPLKTWPLARFEAVAHAIADRTGRGVVFCGDPADRDLPARCRLWRPDRFTDRVGTTSLAELLALIAAAELVLSNDTATIHLALALRRPSVAVLGGGLPGRYHPYPASALDPGEPATLLPVALAYEMPCFDCGWHCRFVVPAGAPAPCIANVATDRITAAVLARLAAPVASPRPVRDDPPAGAAECPDGRLP